MRVGGRVVVRRIGEHMVVIDPARQVVEAFRTKASRSGKVIPRAVPTTDDTIVKQVPFTAVRAVELFVARDGTHRLVLAVGSREGIDLGEDVTQAQGFEAGKRLARRLQVSLDIQDGDFLEAYFRERGPVLSRVHEHKHLIEATLVDPIDPRDELLSPWGGEPAQDSVEVAFEEPDDGAGFSMEDL